MDVLNLLREPESAVFLVAVVAIVVMGVVMIVKALLRHRERVEMIKNGMRPDSDPDDRDQR